MNVLNLIQSFFSDGSHWHGYDGIPQRVWEHLQYTAGALAIAAAVGLPVGLVTGHTGRGGNALAFVSAGARALPTFGLLVLMFVWLGLGIVPVMIPLVVLAVPPILITTYEAIRTLDPSPVDAARGMGMPERKVLFQVEVAGGAAADPQRSAFGGDPDHPHGDHRGLCEPRRSRPLHPGRPLPAQLREGGGRRGPHRDPGAARAGAVLGHCPGGSVPGVRRRRTA